MKIEIRASYPATDGFLGERMGACEICNDDRVCPAYVRKA